MGNGGGGCGGCVTVTIVRLRSTLEVTVNPGDIRVVTLTANTTAITHPANKTSKNLFTLSERLIVSRRRHTALYKV
jgi:hypothetical protein